MASKYALYVLFFFHSLYFSSCNTIQYDTIKHTYNNTIYIILLISFFCLDLLLLCCLCVCVWLCVYHFMWFVKLKYATIWTAVGMQIVTLFIYITQSVIFFCMALWLGYLSMIRFFFFKWENKRHKRHSFIEVTYSPWNHCIGIDIFIRNFLNKMHTHIYMQSECVFCLFVGSQQFSIIARLFVCLFSSFLPFFFSFYFLSFFSSTTILFYAIY